MIGSSTRHWFSHTRASSADYARAWESGLDSGNPQHAAYAFGHNMHCRFYQGVEFSQTRRSQWAIELLQGGLQVLRYLQGAEAITPSSNECYAAALERHRNIQVACIYEALQAQLFLLLNDPARAMHHADRAAPLIYTVGNQGLLPWPEFVFTGLLIQTGLVVPTYWTISMSNTWGRGV